jgi:cobalt-zinc-cadmium efflux system membrane fusion protein
MAALATVLTVGGAFAWRARHAQSAPPAPVADVPHVEDGSVVFSESFAKRAGIETVTARKAPLRPAVRVVGTVSFDPEHVAAVGTRIRGLVRRIAKLEGDSVKKGDVLAEIESAELGEAQAAVRIAAAQRRAAKLNAAREQDLASQKLSTARESEVAAAALAEHDAMLSAAAQRVEALGGKTNGPFGVYVLRAPLDGTLVERHVSPGQSVEDHLVAFRVANLDYLWVELDVFERSLAQTKKGDIVEINPIASPDAVIKGHVAYVGDVIDLATRSAKVRVEIDNKERLLRPGQSVVAVIEPNAPAREAVLVPESAVTYVDGRAVVFVAEAKGRVRTAQVQIGASDGKQLEVVEGLSDGQEIVSEGVFALKSELYR